MQRASPPHRLTASATIRCSVHESIDILLLVARCNATKDCRLTLCVDFGRPIVVLAEPHPIAISSPVLVAAVEKSTTASKPSDASSLHPVLMPSAAQTSANLSVKLYLDVLIQFEMPLKGFWSTSTVKGRRQERDPCGPIWSSEANCEMLVNVWAAFSWSKRRAPPNPASSAH